MDIKEKKQDFLNSISVLVYGLIYYDCLWKNDEDVTTKDIDYLIKSGEVTRQEIIDRFCLELDRFIEW